MQLSIRVSALALCGFVVVVGLAQLATADVSLTELDRTLAIASAALMTVSIAWNHATAGPWFAVGAATLIVVPTTLGASDSPMRLQASVTLFLLAYLGVLLVPTRWGPPWVVGTAALWVVTVSPIELPAVVGETTVNIRWATLVQLVVSGLWLWVVWRTEVTLLRGRDVLARRAEEEALESIRFQERMQVWRRSLVRTHETVLNDIRYVLDAPELDRERLAAQLAQRNEMLPPAPRNRPLALVVEEIRTSEGLGERLVAQGLGRITLTDEQEPAVRAALTEAIRNALRHTDARTVRVVAEDDGDVPRVRISHDGRHEPGGSDAMGIGTGIVILEGIESIGGSASFGGGSVVLALPPATGATIARESASQDSGRLVISAISAGNAVGGGLYYVALALGGGADLLAGALALAVAAVGARSAVRRSAGGPAALLLTAAIATAVPLLPLSTSSSCTELELAAIVSVLTSFGFCAAIVWVSSARLLLLAVGPALAVFWMTGRYVAQCPGPSTATFGTALLLPLCVGLILISLRMGARRVSRLQQLRRGATRQAATAAAEADLGMRLGSSVERAQALMSDVAAGAELDADRRTALRCVDSEIRASLQVDLALAGAVTRTAHELVRAATAASVPVRVLTLRDSGDDGPLPPQLVERLRQLVVTPSPTAPTIQVLTTPVCDTLVITTTVQAIEASGTVWEDHEPSPDVQVAVEYSEPSDLVVVLVNRAPVPVAHPVLSWAPAGVPAD